MKNKIRYIFFCFLILSCGNEKEELNLTLVFDSPLEEGKYPPYFKDIVMPFESPDCEIDFLLKPISVVRLDIKRIEIETNAWYFENMGDNTIEFSKGWLKHYFTDSLTNKYLTLPPKILQVSSIKKYLTNEKINVFIFSEESELDEYEGKPVLHSAKEVNAKIKETACNNISKKVVVLMNPSELIASKPPIGTGEGTGGTPLPNPCEVGTVADAFDLKEDLLEIINTNKNYETRVELANKVWETYFDKNAYVENYKFIGDTNQDVWDVGQGKNYFTNRLAILESITDVNIFRIEKSKKSGRISGIFIIECHNATSIL